MNKTNAEYRNLKRDLLSRQYFLSTLISLSAICGAFIIAISALSFNVKLWSFFGVLGGYGTYIFVMYTLSRKYRSAAAAESAEPGDSIFTKEIDEKIGILDEAAKFFSASLKSDDMFRLVSSRIGDIIPHSASVLFLVSPENKLEAIYASGENARAITKISFDCDEGLAGKAFVSGAAQLDPHLTEDRKVVDNKILKRFESALAVPLIRGVETFGVLVLYGGTGARFDETHRSIIEAIGSRIAPLLVSSFSFEQNISNSMTDSLTNLPNERAFYLVLENQIAEAQRFQKERPLTILTIDIKEFAQFNRQYGHGAGDKLLAFASKLINDNLRQMDFLCRSMSDEFWVVLPTASDEITKKIIKRVESAFKNDKFALPDEKDYEAAVNFGSATFLRDGETTNQLLQKALLRKKQSKANEESTVIMFPKEYVN